MHTPYTHKPLHTRTKQMMVTMARCKHPLALPGVLVLIVAAFHCVLLAAGVSLEQAQADGWVLKPAVSGEGWHDMWHGSS